MIIVKFCSGIGNQLYQYAVYYMLKQKYPNQIVKADISVFEDYELLNHGNGFDYGFGLDKFFNIEIDIADKNEIDKINYEMFFGKMMRYFFPKFVKKYAGNSLFAKIRAYFFPKYRILKDKYITNIPFDAYNGMLNELENNQDYYVSGLWQNYHYISTYENALRRNLVFKNGLSSTGVELLKMINEVHSVCIHVRRGDFTSKEYKYSHDLCDVNYYTKSMRIICDHIDNPRYFVFSDDISFCKKIFYGIDNVIYVSGDYGFSTQEEMLLMSKCKSAIIGNSTFAFWSCWLSDDPNKIVIAPKYSVREKNIWHFTSLPNHWIVVDNLEDV